MIILVVVLAIVVHLFLEHVVAGFACRERSGDGRGAVLVDAGVECGAAETGRVASRPV